MNYFSHYLTLPTLTNKHVTLGAILPDLLRDSKLDGSVFLERQFLELNLNQEHLKISEGVRLHLIVDKCFHNSDFFKKYTKQISASIRASDSITVEKYTYFIAHILLELYIDFVLMKDKKLKVNQLYTQLNQVDDVIIKTYFKTMLPNHDFELFLQKKNKFVESRFLEKYNKLSHLGKIVSMVLKKVSIKELTTSDQEAISRLIEQKFGTEIETDLPALFNEIKHYEKTFNRYPTNSL